MMHLTSLPLITEGAGNAGCTSHPLPCVQNQKRRTQANTGTPKSRRHSLRNGFTAAPCSSWCAGLVSHHRPRGGADQRPTSPIHQLDSSVGEPEPHGLTVRIVPHVLRPEASIATRLTSGDEWPSRPPCRGGLCSFNHKFRLSGREIFLRKGMDKARDF